MAQKISHDKIVEELKRELSTRKHYYPLWMRSGKIAEAVAKHRIAVFEQLLSDYSQTNAQPTQTTLNI